MDWPQRRWSSAGQHLRAALPLMIALASHTTLAFHLAPFRLPPPPHSIGNAGSRAVALRKAGPVDFFRPPTHRGWSRSSAMTMMLSPKGPLASQAFIPPPPEQVLKAVEKGNFKVTAQDVATLAGVDLRSAQKGLVTLATLVQGDLEVTKDGDLVYKFPPGFRTALRTRSVTQRAKELWVKVWPSLFYAVRVSFGLALVLSIVLIFTTIAVAGSASVSTGSNDERREDRRGSSASFGFGPRFLYPSPFDFLWPRPYGYYYTQDRSMSDKPAEMGFLESCFSYIFGDGDPNVNFEEERFQVIAQVIRKNGGAVVAEQLAPYLDAPPPQDTNAYAFSGSNALSGVVDESFMLPVLTRLNGRPEVTTDGNIIYLFPDLMTSAVDDVRASRTALVDRDITTKYAPLTAFQLREILRGERVPCDDCYDKSDLLNRLRDYLLASPSQAKVTDIPPLMLEEEVPFSLAPVRNRIFAGILGVVNLGGALVLGNILRQYAAVGALPVQLSVAAALYAPLLTYAIGFNVIPALRNMWNKERNREITQRNESRERWASILSRAVGPLYNKILAARGYRSKLKVLKDEDITYSTNKSVVEQAERQAMSDFDAKLRE